MKKITTLTCLFVLFNFTAAQKTIITEDNLISVEFPCKPAIIDTLDAKISQCATDYAVLQLTRSVMSVPKKNEMKKEEDLEDYYRGSIDGFTNGGRVEILTKNKFWLGKFYGYELSGYLTGIAMDDMRPDLIYVRFFYLEGVMYLQTVMGYSTYQLEVDASKKEFFKTLKLVADPNKVTQVEPNPFIAMQKKMGGPVVQAILGLSFLAVIILSIFLIVFFYRRSKKRKNL